MANFIVLLEEKLKKFEYKSNAMSMSGAMGMLQHWPRTPADWIGVSCSIGCRHFGGMKVSASGWMMRICRHRSTRC